VTLSGCTCDTFTFYEVIRTPTDECDITPTGEFCVEPEQVSPPTFEVWAIERRADEVRVIVDEEVWIASAPLAETPDRITSSKLEIATIDPGPCTTTTTRSFDLIAVAFDDASGASELVGTLNESTRLTGPEDCGETPRGLRTVASLAGDRAGAP
jgi:hypothetical protein